MAIIRFKKGKKNPYFLMHNASVNDQRLSMKAKGLLAYLICKPDYWYVNYNDLVSASTDGIKSVRSTIKELIRTGYLVRSQLRSNNGQFGFYDFTVYEKPRLPKGNKINNPPHCLLGHAVRGHAEKVTPINTDLNLITDKDKATTSSVVDISNAAAVISLRNKEPDPDSSNILKLSSNQKALIEKKKITLLKLFDEIHIQSSDKIFNSFPLDDIFKYCQWMKSRQSTPKNPTGFFITALKEKWIDEISESPEHKDDRYHWYKCNICKRQFGFLCEMPDFTTCSPCKKQFNIN